MAAAFAALAVLTKEARASNRTDADRTDADADRTDTEPEETHPNPWAVAASIVPGIVVHGSGHLVNRDTRTGYRLLALEGIGLGTAAAGFVPIVLSGASRRLVGPAAALTVLGAGAFAISMLADVYGVLAPKGGTGAPSRVAPLVQVGLGTDDGEPFQRYFGRASFRFVYRGMQFTFLDSASATIDPLVYDWLDSWLDEGQSRVHAVLMHIPPIDPVGVRNGSFADRDEAAKLLTKLARGQVDLTLYGHIHTYYPFQNAGIPAYISGGGGAIPERFDGIGRHYLTVDVDPVRGVLQTAVVRIDND